MSETVIDRNTGLEAFDAGVRLSTALRDVALAVVHLSERVDRIAEEMGGLSNRIDDVKADDVVGLSELIELYLDENLPLKMKAVLDEVKKKDPTDIDDLVEVYLDQNLHDKVTDIFNEEIDDQVRRVLRDVTVTLDV